MVKSSTYQTHCFELLLFFGVGVCCCCCCCCFLFIGWSLWVPARYRTALAISSEKAALSWIPDLKKNCSKPGFLFWLSGPRDRDVDPLSASQVHSWSSAGNNWDRKRGLDVGRDSKPSRPGPRRKGFPPSGVAWVSWTWCQFGERPLVQFFLAMVVGSNPAPGRLFCSIALTPKSLLLLVKLLLESVG